MMTETITSEITGKQKRRLTQFCEDALNKDNFTLSKEEAQRAIGKGNVLQTRFLEIVTELGKGRYADQEVQSTYAYPPGYIQAYGNEAKDLEEQATILRDTYQFPLKPLASVKKYPKEAEGLWVIPDPSDIAPAGCDYPYNWALDFALERVGRNRNFNNWRKGKTGHLYLRQTERTLNMWKELISIQGNDRTPVLPAQFGFRHRGRSVLRAIETFIKAEFGLGAFHGAVMLLTHPEREEKWEQLHIDFPGDEYAPGADGQFVDAPIFGWRVGELHFDTSFIGYFLKRYGSASGFLPQTKA